MLIKTSIDDEEKEKNDKVNRDRERNDKSNIEKKRREREEEEFSISHVAFWMPKEQV